MQRAIKDKWTYSDIAVTLMRIKAETLLVTHENK